jgi:small conductance mechanosensitive channel
MIFKKLKAIVIVIIFVHINNVGFSVAFAVNGQSVGELDQLQAKIERQNKTINDIERRTNKADGILKEALELRLDKALMELLEENLIFVKGVAEQGKSGVEVEKYKKQAIEIVTSQGEIAGKLVKRIANRIDLLEPGKTAADLAGANKKKIDLLDSLNRINELLLQGLELQKQFGVDVTEKRSLFKSSLAERAANGSAMLELAMQDVLVAQARADAVPNDKEAQAMLSVKTNRVRDLAGTFDAVLVMMKDLEMDTSEYQAQVLSATGQITTDLFNFSVISDLLMEWWQSLWEVLQEDGPDLIFKLLLFIIIIYVFRKLAYIVQKIIEKALAKSHLQISELLRRMVVSIVRNTIIVLGILIGLSQIGVSLGPLLAGLGVVGFIIGFALQDLLSNFAAGMMILIYRPFDVGDLIEAAGVSGKVNYMSLVNTTVLTLDNQTIIIPNNKIWGDVIRNITAQTMRRVDMTFGISYSDDIPKAEQVLQEILDSHEKVLADPEPIVRLHELGDSSVNFAVWPWVAVEDYFEVYWDITRAVKIRFDEEGISIPFPQRDVHIYNQDSQ